MYVFTINNKKITLAAVIITVAFVLIIIRALHREQPEPGERPDTLPDGNYRYTRRGRPGTQNFSAGDFDCKDGTPVPAAFYGNLQFLMENLEVLRAELGVPIHVNSGYRTPAYNAKLSGSASGSTHLKAAAADITAFPFTARHVHGKILELVASGRMHNGGLGLYSSFVHYDVRPGPARWTG